MFYHLASIPTLLISLLLFLLEDKDVFLNGNDSCSGRVGIAAGAQTYWLSGSAKTWKPESANAVCQQVNCGAARNFSAIPSRKMKNIWNGAYSCSTNTSYLFDCQNTSVPSDHRNTVAMVTCSGNVTQSLQSHPAGVSGCFLSMSIFRLLLFCGDQQAASR